MTNFYVRLIEKADLQTWMEMRLLLWPHHTPEELLPEMQKMIEDPDTPVFIAIDEQKEAIGFLEGGLRNYADGCRTSPVGYIEGWYVEAAYRRQGVGKALVSAFEKWCLEHGYSEIGSDTWVGNELSIKAHERLGYTVSERLIHFIKKIQ